MALERDAPSKQPPGNVDWFDGAGSTGPTALSKPYAKQWLHGFHLVIQYFPGLKAKRACRRWMPGSALLIHRTAFARLLQNRHMPFR